MVFRKKCNGILYNISINRKQNPLVSEALVDVNWTWEDQGIATFTPAINIARGLRRVPHRLNTSDKFDEKSICNLTQHVVCRANPNFSTFIFLLYTFLLYIYTTSTLTGPSSLYWPVSVAKTWHRVETWKLLMNLGQDRRE